jgi:Leucine-rich repeat (LRR) protein
MSLALISRLEHLNLASNVLSHISPPLARSTSASLPVTMLTNLQRLNVVGNNLSAWADIDAIAGWCPRLQALSITENPLTCGRTNVGALKITNRRELITARIATLEVLDGSRVSFLPVS